MSTKLENGHAVLLVPQLVPRLAPLWRAGTAFSLALMLSGCAGDVLLVGPQEKQKTVELPSSTPRVSGAESAAAREHRQMVQAFGGEYRAPGAHQLLVDTVERLRRASDLPGTAYKVTILNSAVPNAFALPSGNLYVTRGLLVLTNDASEVASVLAHEMAHVTSRHAIERQELESRAVLVSRVRAEVLNNPGAAQLVRDQAQVAIASFSRQQELEADQLGVRTLAKAGFDPYGAHRFLTTLGRNSEIVERAGDTKNPSPDISASHPNTPERLNQALMTARQMGAAGQVASDRSRWLSAVNGMIYGEDPAEGYVRGRTFLHPRLGITFTAPDDYVLENSQAAVLGMTPGATEALRFDSAKVPAETGLDAFLTENKVEGLEMTDVRMLTINGLPAATGLAKGSDWTFRIYAVRVGGLVYRLIMAAQAFSPEVDSKFLRTAESFRKLSADEIARARPLRLAVVAARPGDTAESLSARMGGVDRPLERFYTLNGLEKGAALQPGTLYKTILD